MASASCASSTRWYFAVLVVVVLETLLIRQGQCDNNQPDLS